MKKLPRVMLLYPPNQSWPGVMCKPNGSLAYPSLGGALLQRGVDVRVFDACVGNEKDDLDRTFYDSAKLPSGLRRTGVPDTRILEEVADSDIVGITSIFTDQETMVLHAARLIKESFPEKLIVSGGVNARSRKEKFFAAGVDIVCLSEAEKTIVQIVDAVAAGPQDLSGIPGIAFQVAGRTVANPLRPGDIMMNLDELPIPAWHLLPNERYWRVGRPHGGHFKPGETLRYASMQTSLGCPFACSYCHIAGETPNSLSGPLGRFRIKSEDRVLAELDELTRLGVKQVFVEDDSLFGMKRRAIRLLNQVQQAGFDILDVNGVNLIHLFNSYEPDEEVLNSLLRAGFSEIVVGFESGSQRIIRKYASNKWDVEKHDVHALIRLYKRCGLRVVGNYMIGYPDETPEEINTTITMAKSHREAGLDSANCFLVMPLPGTPLWDIAVAEGYLSEDFQPDRMNWTKANMSNTCLPAAQLEEIRARVWEELNDTPYVEYKRGMIL